MIPVGCDPTPKSCSNTSSFSRVERERIEMENGGDKSVEYEKEEKVKKEEQELSVERVFEKTLVPSWRKQLTLRAFAVSFLLSVMFSFIVMKLNLTTGIIPSLNVSAGLLGFFFVKIWTQVLAKAGMLRHPFTRQENTVIQTCVVASSGIAFSGKIPIPNPQSIKLSIFLHLCSVCTVQEVLGATSSE